VRRIAKGEEVTLSYGDWRSNAGVREGALRALATRAAGLTTMQTTFS
jgi:hypothetical protein